MDRIYYIYKINFLLGSLKGHYYIGKRSSVIRKSKFKWSKYKTVNEWVINEPMFDNYTGSGRIPIDYFKKYGKTHGVTFTKEILHISLTIEENNKKEEEIIGDKYETDSLCENLVKGGIGNKHNTYGNKNPNFGKKLSSEAKLKLSIINKERVKKYGVPWAGKKRTEEEKEQISKKLKEYYKTHKAKGCKHTEESKKKNSEAHKKLWQNEEYRKKCIEALKEHIKKYGSQTKGRRMTDEQKKNLSNYFKGRPNYKNRGKNNGMYGKIPSNARKVLQFDLNGTFIKEWVSIAEASRELHISSANILKVCKGERNRTKNYKWKYK